MKKLIIFSICILFNTNIFAQSSKDKNFVVEQANLFLKACNNGDVDAVLQGFYTPYLVNLGIKETEIKSYFTTLYKQYGEMGQEYQNITISKPAEIIVKNNVWQCIVPYKTIINNTSQKMRIDSKASLWAISKDNGKTWHFLDFLQFDQNKITSIISIFDTDLKLLPLEQTKL